MNYKPTTLYIRKDAPLCAADMIQRQVNIESERDDLLSPKPRIEPSRGLVDSLKPSPGLYNLFRSNIIRILLEMRP